MTKNVVKVNENLTKFIVSTFVSEVLIMGFVCVHLHSYVNALLAYVRILAQILYIFLA